jgi:hypothetical protein
MKNQDALGDLQVIEMNESQINGATTVKYNYLTQNADSTAQGRNVEGTSTRPGGPAGI